MFFTRIGQYAAYLVVRVVICIVQAMSLETCVTASRGLAWFFCRVLRLCRTGCSSNRWCPVVGGCAPDPRL